MKSIKVLFITTSHDQMGNTGKMTGAWLEELATPYYILKDAGAEVTLASPNGGAVPLDPKSQSIMVATSNTKRFLKDEEAMRFLSHSVILEEINADDFDMVFLPGGHGPLWDIDGNKTVKQLLETFNNDGKLIAAVCHGVVGLLAIQDDTGALVIKGKQLTGFSNTEEDSAGLTSIVPVLLETELVTRGALYTKGANHTPHVVADGNIITGQNAVSSEAVAKKMLGFSRINKPVEKPGRVIDQIV